ncbi:uncharacterized protein LOC128680215 [Plodia interpunctella]|uniref:uncharacterized protein LOC128680215 n=1 Tax=Plodia interpunctella TaxID=58824 RepID=UPI002367D947|nr:uncharacterized protein LOC128680215 [Plodia interpunctella]
MNPNKYGFIDDAKVPRVIAKCHRGTQTNENSDSSLNSSKSKGTSPRKGSSQDLAVKVFEFNEIVQDSDHPELITIIRDSFSEETLEHTDAQTKDTTSNRYRYCREVIKPFLTKDYSKDCQSSDDEIIKDVLESVEKDYPDYKPCFKTCSTGTDNCKPKDSVTSIKQKQPVCKTSNTFFCDKVEAKSPAQAEVGSLIFPVPSSIHAENSSSDCTSIRSMDKFCAPSKNCDKDSNCPKINADKRRENNNTPDGQYDEPYDPCAKPKCEKKNKTCEPEIQTCKKPRATAKVPSPPVCPENDGLPCTRKLKSGCESAEDLKELEKQRRRAAAGACGGASAGSSKVDLFPSPRSPLGQKSIIDAHREALDTVMQAASLVICKAYDTTKDTVSLIQSGSAKHLEKIKASKSECEDMCNGPPQPPPKKKDPCEISNIVSKKNLMETIDKLETLDAEDVLHKMVEKMDSTISMISEHIDFDTIANILKSDQKNDYDKPTTPPQKLKLRPSHHSPDEQPSIESSIHDSIQANINTAGNVFTAIKSKIFSIFSEVTKGTDKEKPDEQREDFDDEDES